MWTGASAQEGDWRDSGVFQLFFFLLLFFLPIIWPYWGVEVVPGLWAAVCSCRFLCTLPVQVWTCLCIKLFDFVTKLCTLCSNMLCPFSHSRFLNKFWQRNRPSLRPKPISVLWPREDWMLLFGPHWSVPRMPPHATSLCRYAPFFLPFFCLSILHCSFSACASPTKKCFLDLSRLSRLRFGQSYWPNHPIFGPILRFGPPKCRKCSQDRMNFFFFMKGDWNIISNLH